MSHHSTKSRSSYHGSNHGSNHGSIHRSNNQRSSNQRVGYSHHGNSHHGSIHHQSQSSHQRKQIDIQNAVSIIDNRLYFLTTRYRPKSNDNIHFFTIDNVLLYEPFFVDFGPLNLGCLYKFCGLLKHKLKDERYSKSRIYYYCDKDPQRIANASYLIGAFEIIELGRHPSMAYEIIKPIALKAVPFRDASMGLCTYKCTVEHCLWAVYRSLQRKYLNFNEFNVDEYQHYERVECGDLNIIIPNKFIAFAGPHYNEFDEEGYPALTPQFYLPIWKKFGVTTIVRLNKKCYDKRVWTQAGYEHFDLYFIDGTTPSDSIIHQFLEICEKAKGVCAIHCKAGLGRTGSLLGCYFMKHFCWKASECIAWLRICRPGSVIGPQQQFLEKMQPIMWREGDGYRKKHGIELEFDPRIEEAQLKAEKLRQKEFANRFVQSQQNKNNNASNSSMNESNASNSSINNNNNNNNSNNSNNSNNANTSDEKEQNLIPLPTDPGQKQGEALLNAKRHHKGDYMPKHLFTPENSASDLINDSNTNNNNNSNNSSNNNDSNNNNNVSNGYRSNSRDSHSHNHNHNHSHTHMHGYGHGYGSRSMNQYAPQGQSMQHMQNMQNMQQHYQHIHGTQSQKSKSNVMRSQSSGTPNRSSKQQYSNSLSNGNRHNKES